MYKSINNQSNFEKLQKQLSLNILKGLNVNSFITQNSIYNKEIKYEKIENNEIVKIEDKFNKFLFINESNDVKLIIDDKEFELNDIEKKDIIKNIKKIKEISTFYSISSKKFQKEQDIKNYTNYLFNQNKVIKLHK